MNFYLLRVLHSSLWLMYLSFPVQNCLCRSWLTSETLQIHDQPPKYQQAWQADIYIVWDLGFSKFGMLSAFISSSTFSALHCLLSFSHSSDTNATPFVWSYRSFQSIQLFSWTLSSIYLQVHLHSAILSLSSEFLKHFVNALFSCKIFLWFFFISLIFKTFCFSLCFLRVHLYLWSTFSLAALKPLLDISSNCIISVLAMLRYFWFFICQVSWIFWILCYELYILL